MQPSAHSKQPSTQHGRNAAYPVDREAMGVVRDAARPARRGAVFEPRLAGCREIVEELWTGWRYTRDSEEYEDRAVQPVNVH